ncbi:hypothetical protein A2U01_0057419, partial [Trifolium medium]|nr:hypothetical protein [Trifolium medium]
MVFNISKSDKRSEHYKKILEMYNMQDPACVDDLVLMADPLVSSCKNYELLWYLQTIVQDETQGVEIDVRIDVEASSQGSASSAKEAGSTQNGVHGQATDLILNDL